MPQNIKFLQLLSSPTKFAVQSRGAMGYNRWGQQSAGSGLGLTIGGMHTASKLAGIRNNLRQKHHTLRKGRPQKEF
jgi:hypothetical protein